MTIKEANELKEGCNKFTRFNIKCGDINFNNKKNYCPKCKAKAKAKLEGLGCGKQNNPRDIDGICTGCACGNGFHKKGCPADCDIYGSCWNCKDKDIQEEKEIYEGMLK